MHAGPIVGDRAGVAGEVVGFAGLMARAAVPADAAARLEAEIRARGAVRADELVVRDWEA